MPLAATKALRRQLFTDWQNNNVSRVWVKSRVWVESATAKPKSFDATLTNQTFIR
ncbi:MAG: hypothetical protein IPM55_21715 [Acidobacteria bacterium]|nr:hypothetical protein [Acidobacteriota bacterium]